MYFLCFVLCYQCWITPQSYSVVTNYELPFTPHTVACIHLVNSYNIMKIYCVNMQKSCLFPYLAMDTHHCISTLKLWDVVCLKQQWQESIIKCYSVISSFSECILLSRKRVRQRTILEFACACVWFWMKYQFCAMYTYLSTFR